MQTSRLTDSIGFHPFNQSSGNQFYQNIFRKKLNGIIALKTKLRDNRPGNQQLPVKQSIKPFELPEEDSSITATAVDGLLEQSVSH